jgi:hypothetical protein
MWPIWKATMAGGGAVASAVELGRFYDYGYEALNPRRKFSKAQKSLSIPVCCTAHIHSRPTCGARKGPFDARFSVASAERTCWSTLRSARTKTQKPIHTFPSRIDHPFGLSGLPDFLQNSFTTPSSATSRLVLGSSPSRLTADAGRLVPLAWSDRCAKAYFNLQ